MVDQDVSIGSPLYSKQELHLVIWLKRRSLWTYFTLFGFGSVFCVLTEKKIIVDIFHFVWFWQRLSHVGRGGGTGGMNPKGGEDDDDDDRGDDDDD